MMPVYSKEYLNNLSIKQRNQLINYRIAKHIAINNDSGKNNDSDKNNNLGKNKDLKYKNVQDK